MNLGTGTAASRLGGCASGVVRIVKPGDVERAPKARQIFSLGREPQVIGAGIPGALKGRQTPAREREPKRRRDQIYRSDRYIDSK